MWLVERSANCTVAPGLGGAFSPLCGKQRMMGSLCSVCCQHTDGLVSICALMAMLSHCAQPVPSLQEDLGGLASDMSHFQLKAWGYFTCFSLA